MVLHANKKEIGERLSFHPAHCFHPGRIFKQLWELQSVINHRMIETQRFRNQNLMEYVVNLVMDSIASMAASLVMFRILSPER